MLWNFIQEVSIQMLYPWLMIGDLSQLRTMQEKYNAQTKLEGAVELQSIIDQVGLIKLKFIGA